MRDVQRMRKRAVWPGATGRGLDTSISVRSSAFPSSGCTKRRVGVRSASPWPSSKRICCTCVKPYAAVRRRASRLAQGRPPPAASRGGGQVVAERVPVEMERERGLGNARLVAPGERQLAVDDVALRIQARVDRVARVARGLRGERRQREGRLHGERGQRAGGGPLRTRGRCGQQQQRDRDGPDGPRHRATGASGESKLKPVAGSSATVLPESPP